MSSAPIKAGQAFVELTVRNKLNAGLKSATGQLKAFASGVQSIGAGLTGIGASIGGIGAAIVGPLAGAAKHFADTGSAIADMSARTGVATDHLSELVYAAEQGGASAADLEVALKTMAKNGLDPNRFDETAASIAAISDPAERVAAALKLWGKGGTKLLPILDSIQALRGEARGLGLSIDPKAAERADALGDAMDRLLKVGKDLVFEVGSAIAEPLTRFADLAAKVGASLASWIQQNQGLVVAIAAIGIVATTVGAAIFGFGVAVLAIGAAIAGVTAAFTFIATPIGAIVIAIAAVVASLVVAIAAFALFTKAGQDSVKFLGEVLTSGSLQNAWGLTVKGLYSVWAMFTEGIVKLFTEAMRRVIGSFQQMQSGISKSIIQSSAGGNWFSSILAGADVAKIQAEEDRLTKELNEGNLKAGRPLVKGRDVAADMVDAADQQLRDGVKPALDLLKGIDIAAEAGTALAQAELDKLRAQIAAQQANGFNLPQLPKFAAMIGKLTEEGIGGNMGGAAGTFNAAAAGLLGRSGGPMDRTAKAAEKQNGILENMRKLLEGIDEGIEDLEGFSFQ